MRSSVFSLILGLFSMLLVTKAALACIMVAGDSITAGELARAEPAFAALDPHTALALAPVAGAVRVMRAGELAALKKRYQIAGESAPVEVTEAASIGTANADAASADSGSAEVCFERASEPLTATLLKPVLAQELRAAGSVEIVEFSQVRIPLGERKFEITSAASTMVHGRVTYGGGHSVTFWVRVRTTSTAPGTPGRGFPSGNLPDLPRSDETIRRGDPVNVEVRSGRARLTFDSTAESSGQAGESILVRNPENGKLFQAKVQGAGKVLVQR